MGEQTIDILPFRFGWKTIKCPGAEPVYLEEKEAITYATFRAQSESIEKVCAIRIFAPDGVTVERIIPPPAPTEPGGAPSA